ncbi:hypothetical protein [Salinicola avicenniae]|uniref:hypothetical protein n=1 Tax=Salinicola avicenniae TaxID=2916836 RepID=UPI002073294E|nr:MULTISPECIES: hypothetical protein [unclassified Salinicola]
MTRITLDAPCYVCGFKEFYVAAAPSETRRLRCANCTAHRFESDNCDVAVARMSDQKTRGSRLEVTA